LQVGTDSHDHLLEPEQLMHFAMSRQYAFHRVELK
jgi:hypothetical protein